VKDSAELATHVRSTLQASRDAVRRAHERAADVQQRAQRMRESMRARVKTHDAASRNELTLFEEQSARAQRENQRFVAVVSHELRQPLNAAMGAMSLLDADPSPAATERARVVLRRQLLHMSTLLDDLLDMSRLALKKIRVARAPIDVRQLLEDAVDAIDPAASNAGVQLTCSLPDAPVVVLADTGRLQQAFSNLLTNGVRYTPSGGGVNVSLTVKAGTAEITVEDTGQGITPADLSSIFEPFWSGHDSSGDGFGIGLAVVRGIVELHDGSIAAFSDGSGKGARFCISLPIAES
jgi:signal transduction histidine kinase